MKEINNLFYHVLDLAVYRCDYILEKAKRSFNNPDNSLKDRKENINGTSFKKT